MRKGRRKRKEREGGSKEERERGERGNIEEGRERDKRQSLSYSSKVKFIQLVFHIRGTRNRKRNTATTPKPTHKTN